ncbi:MAG: type II toxin-antitoxin system VapC family toxin [Candidatus Nanopelagicales bacterium]|jgi:predicted nucleic acid-binding protein
MIGYLDTSALVPLLVEEPSTPACLRFWNDCDQLVSNSVVSVEATAALAQARRSSRITDAQLRAARAQLDELLLDISAIDLNPGLLARACQFTVDLNLRGYDAIHCATAHSVSDEGFVAASGDAELLEAWHALSISTFDTNQLSR